MQKCTVMNFLNFLKCSTFCRWPQSDFDLALNFYEKKTKKIYSTASKKALNNTNDKMHEEGEPEKNGKTMIS